MPIYDYECRNCGHRMEVIHGVHDRGPGACERCGGPLRKLLASPAIVFKGSGWAKKDRAVQPAAKKEGAAATPDASDSSPAAATAASEGSAKDTPADAGPKSSSRSGSGSTAAD